MGQPLDVKSFFEKAKDYTPWIIRGVVLLAFLLLAWKWNSDHREKARLSKENEVLKLDKAGLVAEKEAKQKDLDKAAQDLLDHDAAWKKQVTDLEKLLGEKPKVIEVIKWRTKPTDASDDGDTTPRNCPAIPATPNTPAQPATKILVAEGDRGHVEVFEITYETKNGNTVLTGKASCVRETPSEYRFWSSPIETSPPPVALKPIQDQPYRWGAGWFLSMTKGGWATGPKVLLPPFDANLLLFKTRLEGDVGLGIGGGGERVLQLSIGTRWK